MSFYTILQGRQALQLVTKRLVIPAHEVTSFAHATQCAKALQHLLDNQRERINQVAIDAQQFGVQKGFLKGQQVAVRKLTKTLSKCADVMQKEQQQMRQAVGVLALEVVKKIAPQLGAQHVVPALIEQALSSVLPDTLQCIRIHPSLAPAMQAQLQRLNLSVEIKVDESLCEFDAVIEAKNSQTQVGLNHQLSMIEAVIAPKNATKNLS
jgi:type III secretion protein L